MIDYWPIRPKIQPFELLSSWIKRISQKYANLIAPIMNLNDLGRVHYDYIDINPSKELLHHLSINMLVSIEEIKKHCFKFYESNFPLIKYPNRKKTPRRILNIPITNPPFLLKIYSL